jgi:deoxyribodipyrimidine photo-lyase
MERERIKVLNTHDMKKRDYVLYWMQQSQRSEYNHALEYAIRQANVLEQPLIVFFGITDSFPDANERHYAFMLEGLHEVQQSLRKRGIHMVIRHISPEKGAVALSRAASLVVVDRGYMRIQRQWREHVAQHTDCTVIQVESDVIVPVETASAKEEYAAATFRPKIQKFLPRFLKPLKTATIKNPSRGMRFKTITLDRVEHTLARLHIDRTVGRVDTFRGGTTHAKRLLRQFIRRKLPTFPELRNDPTQDNLSCMSPYLHFGQISPLYIALQVQSSGTSGAPAYLEELIVRRELSMNFVYYNQKYDTTSCLPAWVQKSLHKHRHDTRKYVYTRTQLENAATHDPYWNAAQQEMVCTGKMHGYMRMYWGKKILEWTHDLDTAFSIALYLNNKYELDGRDPNGYAGVAWCFGKHDRPWRERSIFGTIRYMNDAGLKRRFDADAYVERIQRLTRQRSQA